MKNKKRILLGILLLLLSFSLIAIGTKILKVNKNQPKVTENQLTGADYTKYNSQIREKIGYLDLYLIEQYPITNIEKLSSDQKTLFLLRILGNYKNKEVTEQQLKEKSKEYFSDFDLKKGDLSTISGKILYQYKDQKYTYVSSEDSPYTIQTEEISSKGTATRWIQQRKVYYLKSSIQEGKYKNVIYKTREDCIKKQNSIASIISETTTISKEEFEKIKDKLETITYTFEKKENNYQIKSIVK